METYFKVSRSVRESDVAAFASLMAENNRLKDEVSFIRKLLLEFSESSGAISIQQAAAQKPENRPSGEPAGAN